MKLNIVIVHVSVRVCVCVYVNSKSRLFHVGSDFFIAIQSSPSVKKSHCIVDVVFM